MPAKQARLSVHEERRKFGQSRRDEVSRVSQGDWTAKHRDSGVVDLLRKAQRGHITKLLPIKFARMAASPFGFFRGAVPVMAADLSKLPNTGIHSQICGDAHVRNLGAFAGVDGRLIFDINDFDETIRGPWEWDVKRMAASLVLAGREANNTEKGCKEAVLAFARSYREAMRQFCEMTVLDLARYQVFRHLNVSPVLAVLRKAERSTPEHNLACLTVRQDGKYRFREHKPLQFHLPRRAAAEVVAGLRSYVETLLPERQRWFAQYRVEDVAFRVVGTGSVGVRDYVVLMFGRSINDPLFIQIKEEDASAYAPYAPQGRVSMNQGQRTAQGQRAMQVQSDIFLGWTAIAGRDYLVRQLRDHKGTIENEDLEGDGLVQYGRVCGEMLSKGHARSGDSCAISGYLGNSDKFDKAMVDFGVAYADQSTKDFDEFTRAIRLGKVPAAPAVPPPAKQSHGKTKNLGS
jgi:uncharacterized protein (DUF2252 family)